MADDDPERSTKQMASCKKGGYQQNQAKQETVRDSRYSGVYQQVQAAPDIPPESRAAVQQAPTRPSRSRHSGGGRPAAVPSSTDAPGIVAIPAGSRGPRSLYLKRDADSFGFTLRHFIVYPPESVTHANDGRHAAVGALREPMETIFVKQVYDNSPAHCAGLHHGDRLVSVNGISLNGKSYQQVVQLIQQSPPYLHLLVVPKEDDVLQKFFPETAHNPETNQRPKRYVSPETFNPRRQTNDVLQYRPIVHPSSKQSARSRIADSISWKSYEEPTYATPVSHIQPTTVPRSATRDTRTSEQFYSVPKDSLVYRPIRLHTSNRNSLRESRDSSESGSNIYAEPYAHDFSGRPRAQPQVPPHNRKMGRRASEGSNISDNSSSRDSYEYPECSSLGSESLVLSDMVVSSSKMKSASKVAYTSHLAADSHSQNTYSSVESVPCGLQGLTYTNNAGCRLSLDAGRRESSASLNSSLADGSKDSLSSYDSTSTLTGQDTDDSIIMTRFRKSFEKKEEFLRRPSQPIGWKSPEDEKLIQTVIQREFYGRPQKLQKEWPPNDPNFINGQESPVKHSTKPTHQNFQRVKIDIDSERDYLALQNGKDISRSDMQMARNKFYESSHNTPTQFVVGGPVTNMSPLQRNSNIRQSKDKTSFVTTLSRIHESSNLVSENGGDCIYVNGSTSLPNTVLNDSSLDDRRYPPNLQIVSRRTRQFESGRPVPEDEDESLSDRTNFYRSELSRLSSKKVVPNVAVRKREFETLEIENNREYRKERDSRRTQRESRSLDHSDVPLESENMQVQLRARSNSAESWSAVMQNANNNAQRNRNTLDWTDEKTRNRVMRQDSYITALKSKVPVPGDVPQVVRRTKNNTNSVADEDRVTRRVSYLKATWGDRMHIESDLDLSDTEIAPHVLRSRSASADGSESLSSPERENVPLAREGSLSCKFMELDGKRANDRSWHKVWAVLKGPQLLLYKDRHHHHQSPMGLVGTDQQLPGGVDMRYSVVDVADDYTKRKNVLRISSAFPYRTELLLQADSPVEMADWVRTLQEQTGASTDHEEKQECLSGHKQAVPQQVPAATSVQVQGNARLSPQPSNKSKISNSRNRSPTGQSPKSKTWRGRVVKQFKKLNQGSGSPSSPTTPEKLTFGVPLENCPKSEVLEYVPKFVEMCTEIIEARGLEVVGIYRVPGNSAAVSALTEELNKGINISLQDAKCDTNVVSSLLKSFFRKLPDSLLTSELYPRFIDADKIEDPKARLYEIKNILHDLPIYQYETLKHLILHLKKVMDNSDVNKMEARNLAIMFGPTLVRNVEDNMVAMVTDMSHQCRIVESLLLYGEWFFSEDDSDILNLNTNISQDSGSAKIENTSANANNTLLLENISKIEGIRNENTTRENTKKVVSSIISAANRKIQRKPRKPPNSNTDIKDEPTTPTSDTKDTNITSLLSPHRADEQKQNIPLDSEESSNSDNILPEDSLLLTYPQRDAKNLERIEKFKQETMAMLQKKRRTTDVTWDNNIPPRGALESQHVLSDEDHSDNTGSDLLATMTSMFDNKIKALQSPVNCLTVADNIPYADESPDLQIYYSYDTEDNIKPLNESQKSNILTEKMSPKSFRDPSLHKSNSTTNFNKIETKPDKLDHIEKDVDETSDSKSVSEAEQRVSDELNELCKINNFSTFLANKELKCSASDSKLRRSESLNKSDNRENEQEHGKLKRSVSLNRAADRLRRSDSLTKYEKTESNINLRRELTADGTNRRHKKSSTKLKRKNGMPERSIKRRHTVGGTKDFDKLHWLDNKLRYEAEEAAYQEKENKALRSSSPDLSGGEKLPLESHI